MMNRLVMGILGLAASTLAACGTYTPPPLPDPVQFQGQVGKFSAASSRPTRAYVLFNETFPDGSKVFHGLAPAEKYRWNGATWDMFSMTLDGLRQAGIEVVDDRSAADVELTFTLRSRTPSRLPPIGYAAPDSGAAVQNTALDILTFGIADQNMVAYVNADYVAEIRSPSGSKTTTVPLRASAPFKKNEWNTKWREEAFEVARAMYMPEFTRGVGVMLTQLEPLVEASAIN